MIYVQVWVFLYEFSRRQVLNSPVLYVIIKKTKMYVQYMRQWIQRRYNELQMMETEDSEQYE